MSFSVVRLGAAKQMSDSVFSASFSAKEQPHCEEEEEITPLGEIIEDLHMTVFFIMIGYIVSIVWVISVANRNSKLWAEAENVIDDDAADNDSGDYDEVFTEWMLQQGTQLVGRRNVVGGERCRSCCRCRRSSSGGIFWGATRAHRIVEFDRLKARFIHQANKHPGRIGGTIGSRAALASCK